MALTHPLPPPTPFNPVGFDWSKGSQNIGGTIYDPRMDRAYVTDEAGNIRYDPETGQPALLMTGDGESATYVMRPTGYNKYNEADRKLGNSYEVYDLSGNLLGRESFIKEDFGHGGFFEDLFDTSLGLAKEMAPLATFAVGAGPLAGMLGGAAASTLGISGLSAAQTAALGSAIAGGANTALQGGGIGDVLKSAVMTAAPSFVSPFARSIGADVLKATDSKFLGDIVSGAIRGTPRALLSGDASNLLTGAVTGAVGSQVGDFLGLTPGQAQMGTSLVSRLLQDSKMEPADFLRMAGGINAGLTTPSQGSSEASGMDAGALLALIGGASQDMAKPKPYQVAQTNTSSPFGTVFDEQQDLLSLIGKG